MANHWFLVLFTKKVGGPHAGTWLATS